MMHSAHIFLCFSAVGGDLRCCSSKFLATKTEVSLCETNCGSRRDDDDDKDINNSKKTAFMFGW